ncbi:MAG TPA: nuclear transport factor 2 family protein [Acidothermaceae bacterium]
MLTHFTDDVVFRSPVASRILGGDGIVRGKVALRAYWQRGLQMIPDFAVRGHRRVRRRRHAGHQLPQPSRYSGLRGADFRRRAC